MRRVIVWTAGALLLSVGAWLAAVARQIERQSTRDEARQADAIVILGAAEYRGRPSPVYRARLEHGFELYRKGLARRIITTGGAGGDPHFTEGGVGQAYLVRRGVPSEAITVEQEGSTTAESLAAVAEIMRRMRLESCIVVSDGYHIFRAKKVLESLGFRVYGSPRPSGRRESESWRVYLRQAAAYLLWTLGIRI
ncbi:MAG: YdcF family protein [Bryobacterales bacterium]|nr:YdcF family protein [Bryobacteraceae bacterium]MDW8354942.1 YdcF family protein [Bryobacterales bacterium]